MGYFAGLDVSLEETANCIVDDVNRIVREARAANEPDVLAAFLAVCGIAMARASPEASSLTAWLHAGLTVAGLQAICIEARQAKAAMDAMPNKTDSDDARGIAQIGPGRHSERPSTGRTVYGCPATLARMSACRHDATSPQRPTYGGTSIDSKTN